MTYIREKQRIRLDSSLDYNIKKTKASAHPRHIVKWYGRICVTIRYPVKKKGNNVNW